MQGEELAAGGRGQVPGQVLARGGLRGTVGGGGGGAGGVAVAAVGGACRGSSRGGVVVALPAGGRLVHGGVARMAGVVDGIAILAALTSMAIVT